MFNLDVIWLGYILLKDVVSCCSPVWDRCIVWAITFEPLVQIEHMSPFWKLHFKGFPTRPRTRDLAKYSRRYAF